MSNETLKIILDWASLHPFLFTFVLILLGWVSIMCVGIVETIMTGIVKAARHIFSKNE